MVIHSLTNKVYTSWGIRYSLFNWRPEWYTFIRIGNRECNKDEFHCISTSVKYIIYWFDTNILQKIGIDKEPTLRVRIRIVCGMVNNLHYIPRPMKIEFMECIWDIYKKFYKEWNEYYCKKILELPF